MIKKILATCSAALIGCSIVPTAGAVPSKVVLQANDAHELYPNSTSDEGATLGFSKNDYVWLEKYAKETAAGVLYFDIVRAEQDHLTGDQLRKLKSLNDIALEFARSSDRSWWDDAGTGIFSGYNYCGRGNLGWDKAPVNVLDAGCREHDLCYDQTWYDNCNCDRDFVAYIDDHLQEMGFFEKRKAEGARFYFQFRIDHNKCRT